jgi:hypothetical protein
MKSAYTAWYTVPSYPQNFRRIFEIPLKLPEKSAIITDVNNDRLKMKRISTAVHMCRDRGVVSTAMWDGVNIVEEIPGTI